MASRMCWSRFDVSNFFSHKSRFYHCLHSEPQMAKEFLLFLGLLPTRIGAEQPCLQYRLGFEILAYGLDHFCVQNRLLSQRQKYIFYIYNPWGRIIIRPCKTAGTSIGMSCRIRKSRNYRKSPGATPAALPRWQRVCCVFSMTSATTTRMC